MASIYAWQSPLPSITPSAIAACDMQNYGNSNVDAAHPGLTQALVHLHSSTTLEAQAPAPQALLAQKVDQGSCSHTTSSTTVEDLDFLDYAPVFSPDMFFGLGTPSPDMGMECDDWSLLSNESNSSWKSTSQSDPVFINNKCNPTVNNDEQAHPQIEDCVENQPVPRMGSLTGIAELQAKQSGYNGSSKKDSSKGNDALTSSPSSNELKAMDNVPMELQSTPASRTFKRQRSSSDMKRIDSSDLSEDEELHNKVGSDGRVGISKNLVSERRRRMKLNEKLYSLRAIVPKISKMDKASIVGDAISYVKDLQKQVQTMQEDILALQAGKEATLEGLSSCAADRRVIKAHSASEGEKLKYKVLQMDVSTMEENTHHLRIHCKKGPGVLVQLTKAFESLDSEIVSANLTTVSDHILNTVVLKVDKNEVSGPEDLKQMLMQKFPRFGLQI